MHTLTDLYHNSKAMSASVEPARKARNRGLPEEHTNLDHLLLRGRSDNWQQHTMQSLRGKEGRRIPAEMASCHSQKRRTYCLQCQVGNDMVWCRKMLGLRGGRRAS
jgi:hypothetical protein